MNNTVQMIETSAGLVTSRPLEVLVLAAVAGAVWQTRALAKEREINRLLVREMLAAKQEAGVAFSEEAERTITGLDRRRVNKHRDPDRRKG